jgi:hypothetical protein
MHYKISVFKTRSRIDFERLFRKKRVTLSNSYKVALEPSVSVLEVVRKMAG